MPSFTAAYIIYRIRFFLVPYIHHKSPSRRVKCPIPLPLCDLIDLPYLTPVIHGPLPRIYHRPRIECHLYGISLDGPISPGYGCGHVPDLGLSPVVELSVDEGADFHDLGDGTSIDHIVSVRAVVHMRISLD